MPQSQRPPEIEDVIKEKLDIVKRAQFIVDGLRDNGAWEMVLEDFGKECNRLDDNWCFVKDVEVWKEWRVTKLAVLKVLNLVDDYKADMDTAQAEIAKITSTDDAIIKDFDNG